MKLEEYINSVEKIVPSEELNESIYEACVKGKKHKKNKMWQKSAACVCAAALLLSVGIPVLSTNSQTGKGELGLSGITINVKADGVEEKAVIGKLLSSGDVSLHYDEVEVDGEAKTVFSGSNYGTSFRIDGENIEKLTYESSNQGLHCEFDSQNHPGGSEEFVWSGYTFGFETEEFLKFVADPENPKKEELVALLEDKREKLRNGQTDDYHEMERFEEITGRQDIDFSSLILSGEIAYKGESSMAFVFVRNPDNEFVAPVQAANLTTKSGEYVDWVFSRETVEYLSDTPQGDVDFSRLNDNVKITAYMKDGSQQVINYVVTFDENGKSTACFTAEEDESPAG